MPKTEIPSGNIRDGEVRRQDLNISTPNDAVVAKVLAGGGLGQTQTGIDVGTGDTTLRVKDRLFLILSYNGQTTSQWFRVGDQSISTQQAAFMFDKNFYVKKVLFSHKNTGNVGQIVRFRAHSVPDTVLADISTADPIDWDISSNDVEVIKNIGEAKNWIWISQNENRQVDINRRYGFRLERVAGNIQMNDVHCHVELEEVVP